MTDIRLIELGQLIAGPYCGQLMADMGADVIKVEPPRQGDPMRVWGRGDYPLWWSVCARNKRCVTANLREAEGQELVRRLIASADMVLENFRPGTLERWGLGYDDLVRINPGIIMIRVSGYGQTGPYSSRAGYASIGEAMGGMRYLCGEPDRQPSRAGLSIGDTLAATFACNGALAALHHRDRTGEGQVIDASIYESVLSVMEATIPEYVVSDYIRERSGATLPNVAPSNIYDCSDGSFLIAANQDTVFKRLCETMGRPELASDERFSTHTVRGRQHGNAGRDYQRLDAHEDDGGGRSADAGSRRARGEELPRSRNAGRPALRGPQRDRRYADRRMAEPENAECVSEDVENPGRDPLAGRHDAGSPQRRSLPRRARPGCRRAGTIKRKLDYLTVQEAGGQT